MRLLEDLPLSPNAPLSVNLGASNNHRNFDARFKLVRWFSHRERLA